MMYLCFLKYFAVFCIGLAQQMQAKNTNRHF